MNRVRIAIDGCGTLTQETILHHLDQPDFKDVAEVVACCDIVRERAQEAADRHGIPHVFGDYAEMLAKVDCDAVLIIVPHHVHAEHALMAIRAGRHVYVQKPMAPSYVEALQLVRAVEETGVKLVAAPGQVLWPMYDQIREVIDQGEIGPVFFGIPPLMGWGGEDVGFPFDPSWFFSKDGGPLRDHGGYGFQTLVRLLGPVRRVAAFSANMAPTRRWNGVPFECTGHDNSMVMLDHGGGTFGLLPETWSDTAPGVRFMRVHGLSGAIQTDRETFNWLDILPIGATVYRIGKPEIRLECPLDSVPFTRGKHPECGHVHVYGDILHLVECIRDDLAPKADVYRGAHFVAMVEAAFRAAETGVTQELPAALGPGLEV